MKRIGTALSLVLLSVVVISCGSTLPTYYYRINTNPETTKSLRSIPLKVEVNSVRVPDRYQDRIVYRKGEYEYGFYEYSRWIDTPEDMIRRTLINALYNAELFSMVDPFGNHPDSDLNLNSEIVSFDQIVDKKENYADFKLILEFNRSDTGISVWSFRTEEKVKQDGRGFAAAMSEAVRRAVNRAVVEMEESKELREISARID